MMRKNNPNNFIVGHLNINTIRNKFSAVKELLSQNLNLLVLSETKIDDSFPNNQFWIDGYKLFRKDRNAFGEDYVFM